MAQKTFQELIERIKPKRILGVRGPPDIPNLYEEVVTKYGFKENFPNSGISWDGKPGEGITFTNAHDHGDLSCFSALAGLDFKDIRNSLKRAVERIRENWVRESPSEEYVSRLTKDVSASLICSLPIHSYGPCDMGCVIQGKLSEDAWFGSKFSQNHQIKLGYEILAGAFGQDRAYVVTKPDELAIEQFSRKHGVPLERILVF